jgi:group I intron endonuclease
MSTGIIYLIINKENGHKYVGQTTQPMNKRWQQHIQEAMRMSDKPLHRAMRKHGNHNFMIKEIDECNVNLLNEREEYWIKQYNTFESAEGYNATSGGERPIFDEATKKKISLKMSDIERDEEWVNNISSTLTEKSKKEPWGFLLKENRGSGSSSRIEMLGINIQTGEERIWESARAAAEEVANDSKCVGNILNAANNGWKAYGYRWRKLGKQTNKIKVYGVHKRTWESTPIYDSIRKAAKIHGDQNKSPGSGLTKSLKNPHKNSWKGYYWFYYN